LITSCLPCRPGRESDARAFYQEILGIPEVVKPRQLAARGGYWFEAGALKVHLGVEKDFVPARKAHPAFVVDDLKGLSDEDARQIMGGNLSQLMGVEAAV